MLFRSHKLLEQRGIGGLKGNLLIHGQFQESRAISYTLEAIAAILAGSAGNTISIRLKQMGFILLQLGDDIVQTGKGASRVESKLGLVDHTGIPKYLGIDGIGSTQLFQCCILNLDILDSLVLLGLPLLLQLLDIDLAIAVTRAGVAASSGTITKIVIVLVTLGLGALRLRSLSDLVAQIIALLDNLI